MYPETELKETILEAGEKKTLNITTMKYLIGVKLDNEIMVPRAFFTSSEIKVSEFKDKYYWSIKFGSPLNLSNLSDLDVPSELNHYFASWAAQRYQYNAELKAAFLNEDETKEEHSLNLVSDDYASTGYYQIPGEFFASCYLSFQLEELSIEKIEAIAKCHRKSQDCRSMLRYMKEYDEPAVAKEHIVKS